MQTDGCYEVVKAQSLAGVNCPYYIVLYIISRFNFVTIWCLICSHWTECVLGVLTLCWPALMRLRVTCRTYSWSAWTCSQPPSPPRWAPAAGRRRSVCSRLSSHQPFTLSSTSSTGRWLRKDQAWPEREDPCHVSYTVPHSPKQSHICTTSSELVVQKITVVFTSLASGSITARIFRSGPLQVHTAHFTSLPGSVHTKFKCQAGYQYSISLGYRPDNPEPRRMATSTFKQYLNLIIFVPRSIKQIIFERVILTDNHHKQLDVACDWPTTAAAKFIPLSAHE